MKRTGNGKGSGKGIFGLRSGGMWLGLGAAALGTLLVSYVARADDPAQGPAGAARLSSVEGQVRIVQGGQTIADPALVNAPLFAGFQIETGDDGKAEVQFDDGSVARLSPDSGLTLKSVSGDGGQGTEVLLESGLGYFELQGGGSGGPMRVDFGDSVATASGFTVMRIHIDTPPGDLAVFSGNAHVERGNSLAVDLHGGESVALNANDPTHYDLSETIEPDSWDAWNQDRDQALNATAADQTGAAKSFVNSENPNPAWNDLDANGNWYNVPGSGLIWSPYSASTAGWDPYGCGHWMYTPRFGYVWVSCEQWGFLPYSCGSWNFYGGFGWGWSAGGGCNPWWRNGGYNGWNVGAGPSGYRPLPRPISRGPIGRTLPVIAVNHRLSGRENAVLPQRNGNTPVQIAGHTVQPMHPLPASQSYVRSASGFVYHPGASYQGGAQVGGQGRVAIGSQGNIQAGQANNPHSGYGNRQGYNPPPSGSGYVRQSNQSGASYTSPGQFNTQPSRSYTPPGQHNAEPGRGGSGGNSGGAGSFARPANPGGGGGGAYSGGGGGAAPRSSGGYSGGGGGGASHSSGGGGGFSGGGGGGASHASGGGGGGGGGNAGGGGNSGGGNAGGSGHH